MNILTIDTTNSNSIKVGLKIDSKEYNIEKPLNKHKSQILLPLIDQILKENNLDLKDLTAIEINPGPGSFTGIRIGLAIANTLATLLKIPINNQPIGHTAEPKYQ